MTVPTKHKPGFSGIIGNVKRNLANMNGLDVVKTHYEGTTLLQMEVIICKSRWLVQGIFTKINLFSSKNFLNHGNCTTTWEITLLSNRIIQSPKRNTLISFIEVWFDFLRKFGLNAHPFRCCVVDNYNA